MASVAKIRVVLGHMSPMLGDALGGLIGAQTDMCVVGNAGTSGDVIEVVRSKRADVLIVQGPAVPEPIASVVAAAPLGLLVIDDDGQTGALTRISANSEPVTELSGERLLQAVRSAIGGAR
jgi:hypothetical protein